MEEEKSGLIFKHIVQNVMYEDLIEKGDFVKHCFKETLMRGNKYKVLKESILDNYFLERTGREELIAYFTKIQKTHLSLLRFLNICKFKVRKWDYKYDLYFNELSRYNEKIKISLIEQNQLYTFTLPDLVHIIARSLTHNDNLFVLPSAPCNPFTNIAFSYCNMANIYFKCQSNCMKIPDVFHYYFSCNFETIKLKMMYEPNLREYAIQNYYSDMNVEEKSYIIHEMLDKHAALIPLIIHPDFPKEVLNERFDVCILPYLRSEYSLIPYIKSVNKNKLAIELEHKYVTNKAFGRIYHCQVRNNTYANLWNMSWNNGNNQTQHEGQGHRLVPFPSPFPSLNEDMMRAQRNQPFVFGASQNDEEDMVLDEQHQNHEEQPQTQERDQELEEGEIREINENANSTNISQQEIINRLRIREILAGDDYDGYDNYGENYDVNESYYD